MAAKPEPFTLGVPDAAIADLRDRLARTRLPDQAPIPAGAGPWAYGTPADYLAELLAHWREGFDWRAQEAVLNAFPQYKVPLHGIDLHYLHVPGKGPAKGPDPMPLLLMHGWPGSVYEFIDIIPRLTDPAAFGGDPADAFTVVVPSLPGYGLSFAPGQKRFAIADIADCLAELMTEVLGYRRFAAQGGDFGAFTASCLGAVHAEKLIGIHINLLAMRRDLSLLRDDDPAERRYREELDLWLKEETGYQWIQGTRPQTLAAGLTDSPAGLAAWIAEKFHSWTDNDGRIESAVPRDRMLANISLYWFTGCIGASFWPYYARLHGPWPIPDGKTVDVPAGYAQFPREILHPPRSFAARTYTDIRRWTVMEKGGHFAAMEQPAALAAEVQAFFRDLREG
ncbi:epoxide hydrolase family protein [Roseicella sp. DB1501]|uniref:epoxide hydrolase family protein n=1 Tax=Roseicella sp. DB1501 TaxID=2730925 RepID=UPI0014918D75|nr:epoxide hydrolase family protein [Roseicella sp. DB1501]NOG68978.1 epoxide hydrolase [Roseicella sp. DB1501]